MTSPERAQFLHLVPDCKSVDPFEDTLYRRWDIEGISQALGADASFSDDTFDWKFELNTPKQSKLQDTPPFLKISPNPFYPDGMFPLALFDSGIGGLTVTLSCITRIDLIDNGVKITSRDELGLTEFQLENTGAIKLSTTPYSQIPRTK